MGITARIIWPARPDLWDDLCSLEQKGSVARRNNQLI